MGVGMKIRMYEEDMYLPKGKRCYNCYYFTRCVHLIGIGGQERHCDWSPSRFKEVVVEDA